MTHQCRFCNAEYNHQFIKGDFVFGGKPEQHFWQCRDCETIYIYPPLTDEEETRFYKNEFVKYMEGRAGKDKDWSGPEKHVESNQPEAKRRMGFLEGYLGNVKNALEIGCSSGFMLSALQSRGINVCGLDPSEGFIDYVKSKGIPVYKDMHGLQTHAQKNFDLILHYYVLEHIREPIPFVRQYMELLNEGGKMIFEVPCASDPLVELYHVPAFDKFYWSVAHHWYFNKESLAAMLKKTGYKFELFPEQRYDLSNHITWMLDGKPGGMGRYNHIFDQEFDKTYKEKLKKSWMCDTIIAVLSK